MRGGVDLLGLSNHERKFFFFVITLGQDLFSGPVLTSLLICGDV